ncbi:MAG: proton-conducting transporter membrane subunit, partial [Dehalococcoidia bacterium]
MNGVDLPAEAIFLPILFYAAAVIACVAAARPGRPMSRLAPSWLIISGAVTGTAIAVNALLDGSTETLAGWEITSFARVSFRFDPLAAFILLVISLPAIAAAGYGMGYLDAEPAGKAAHHGPHRAGVDGLLAAFLGAMSLLVIADGVFGFLFAWELMSLVSFFLVIGDGHATTTRRAAFVYVVMTHIGAGLLLIAFLILSRNAGSFDFGPMRDAASALGRWERDAAFLLALIGFGTKAGLIPLHVWLPRAHPVAPSHISALMSGVMVKTAIYGLVRFIWELAGPAPGWWGGALFVLGVVSAVLGILYALMERDLKRVLAYSTIEHVGIITLGLGVAVMLSSGGHQDGAALALVATLVHLLNHALFKGLL